MRKVLPVLAFFLASFGLPKLCGAQAFNSTDSLALVDLYNSTNGPGWVNHTNWLTSQPVYTWFGLYSADSLRVSILALPHNNLVGSLPASIGNVTAAWELDLSYNRLSGTLPASMTNLTAASFIKLSHNQLGGAVPLFQRGSFTPSLDLFLDISYNGFKFSDLEPVTGVYNPYVSITTGPQSDLPLIQNGNILTIAAGGTVLYNTYTWYQNGAVVATNTGDSTYTMTGAGTYAVAVTDSRVYNLTLYSIQNTNTTDSLALIDLYNSTTGGNWLNNTNWTSTAPVTSWYGVQSRFGRVIQVDLSDNELSGPIPTSLGNLQGAGYINLSGNQLTGSLPSSLSNLSSISALYLSGNQLTGSIPVVFGNLTTLTWLGLSHNQLTGSIPSSFGNLAALQTLDLQSNQLTGSIPAELGNSSSIVNIYLSHNQLTDTIPASIGNWSNAYDIEFEGNQLTGSIPQSIGRLKKVELLYLDSNQLSGPIPDSMSFMTASSRLFLNNNQLIGTLPDSLGNCTQLLNIDVENNNLSGTIRTNFANIPYLQALNIYGNKYTFSALPLPPLPPLLTNPVYAPQQAIPITRRQSTLSVTAGGNIAHNTYTLYKGGVPLATQTGDSAFSVTGLGDYNIVTTNTDAPQLTLYSDTLRLGLVLPDSSTSATQVITGTSATNIDTAIFRLVTLTPTAGANALSGDVTVEITIDPSVQTYNGLPYLPRHYDITPASNPTTAQATVTLYYTQADFDAYNAYVTANNLGLPLLPTNGVDNGNVIITQYHGSFTGTSSPGNYNQGSQEIAPTVVWDATDGWWVVSFPVSGFSGFFLGTGSSPLSLTLLQFTGTPQDDAVHLQWETTAEKSTKQFIVQRSPDGSSFDPIGTVAAKNTAGQNPYAFIDTHPFFGSNYYRLKMQDIDGQSTYSPIVQVAVEPADCEVYPNPATAGSTSLFFQSAGATRYTVLVTDMSGRLLTRLEGVSTIGMNKVDLDVRNLTPGAFTLTLVDEQHGRRSLRLMKE